MPLHLRSYKSRVVFQGNNARDGSGYPAVFSEQGTSALHIVAAKLLDAIARMPGSGREDSDAIGAYTQAEHSGEEARVFIPRGRQPPSWSKLQLLNPVCCLRLNL